MSTKTKGEQLIGITFEKGNNDKEQNEMEFMAHLINRIDKARHLGPNFDHENNSIENLNWTVDKAIEKARELALAWKEALEMNQKKS